MSKRILNEDELQAKINKFLTRKNLEMGAKSEGLTYHPMFNFNNDSLTYTF